MEKPNKYFETVSHISIKFIFVFEGMITGAASGILRSIMVTPDNVADVGPVDVVINLVILNKY